MSHDIRIPIKKQPGFNGMSRPGERCRCSGSLHHCGCGCLDVTKLDQPGRHPDHVVL